MTKVLDLMDPKNVFKESFIGVMEKPIEFNKGLNHCVDLAVEQAVRKLKYKRLKGFQFRKRFYEDDHKTKASFKNIFDANK